MTAAPPQPRTGVRLDTVFRRSVARRYGSVTARVLSVCVGLTLIPAMAIAVLTWRLSVRPLESPWLTAQIRSELAGVAAPAQVSLEQAGVFWEGFSEGLESPIDVRLRNLTVRGAYGGAIEIPEARISLAVIPLLEGRFEPRSITLDRPRFDVPAGRDSELAQVVLPDPQSLRSFLSRTRDLHALSELSIRDGAIAVGRNWGADGVNVDIARSPESGLTATASLTVQLAGTHLRVNGAGALPEHSDSESIAFDFAGLRPTALGQAVPALAALTGFDAAVNGRGTVDSGPGATRFDVHLTSGPGMLRVMGTDLALTNATMHITGTPDAVTLGPLRLTVHPPASDASTTIAASGSVQHNGHTIDAALSLGIDRLRFADLGTLWPTDLAHDARRWVTTNITDGTAHDGQVSLHLATDETFGTVRISQISGILPGDGLTVHWLRPVPPAVNGQAVLRIQDPGSLAIDIASGQQLPNAPGAAPLKIESGSVRITGLDQPNQDARVDLHLSGPLPTVLGLLSSPGMNLLAHSTAPMRNADGRIDGTISVGFPLLNSLRMDQIAITTQSRLSELHLPAVMAGQTLSEGEFELTATNDSLNLQGRGTVGGILADIAAKMDFRAGRPDDTVEKVDFKGSPTAAQLAAAGLSTGGVVSGILPLTASLAERRNGTGTLQAQVNLRDATLKVDALAWSKPPGIPASARFVLTMTRDVPQRLDAINVSGPDLLLEGNGTFQDGRLTQVRADRLTLGRTRGQASVSLGDEATPTTATVSGSSLDLSSRLTSQSHVEGNAPARPRRGSPWAMNARFDHVILAHGEQLSGFAMHAVNDGERFRDLRVQGNTGGATGRDEPVLAVIEPAGSERTLRITAADGGALLRGLDLLSTVNGGRLTISGRYEDERTPATLAGTVELNDFRVQNGAALGKLLQAMTLYGLVDAMRGPGLEFSRLVAPFRYYDGVLHLTDASAFSSSLGLTAKGAMDFDSSTVDLQGTVVPAYFFNSLLGRMPLVGRLFSPERGGGLFAASYTMAGPLENPAVKVNPLTALTPGFLRGLFQR